MNSTLKCSVLSIAIAFPFMTACSAAPGDGQQLSTEASNTAAAGDASHVKAASDPAKPTVEQYELSQRRVMSGPIILNIQPSISNVSASSYTVAVGSWVTLTVTASEDIGPTPYYMEIFDVTTGGRVAACGYGATCSGSVSQSAATTHSFIGYLASGLEGTNPPSGEVSASVNTFVTWNSAGYTLSVPVSVSCYQPHGSAVITATANIDVGPTPYYIEVFNSYGTRIGVCSYGTACTVSSDCDGVNYYGFISSYSTTFPPAGIQASSNVGFESANPS